MSLTVCTSHMPVLVSVVIPNPPSHPQPFVVRVTRNDITRSQPPSTPIDTSTTLTAQASLTPVWVPSCRCLYWPCPAWELFVGHTISHLCACANFPDRYYPLLQAAAERQHAPWSAVHAGNAGTGMFRFHAKYLDGLAARLCDVPRLLTSRPQQCRHSCCLCPHASR
jgi:hypothetical protein